MRTDDPLPAAPASDSALAELVARARRAAVTGAEVEGLEPLAGGMSHDVFAGEVDGRRLVLKVFRRCDHGEHLREWEGLQTCASTGRTPRPVLCDVEGDRPVIVATWVDGHALDPAALGPEELEALGRTYRSISHLTPSTVGHAGNHPAHGLPRARRLFDEWLVDARAVAGPLREAKGLAQRWLRGTEPDLLLSRVDGMFVHGDPNLANALFVGGAVNLIDWEDCGVGDLASHVGDLAEHPSTRTVADHLWRHAAEPLGLAADARVTVARRLSACFWLVILHRREARGAAPVQLTALQQADRVLRLLG